MDDLDKAEPLSNISDSSFVILSQGSLHSQEIENNFVDISNRSSLKDNQSNISSVNILDKSTFNDRTSTTTSSLNNAGEESIQDKLNQVMRENLQLRETLSQNNLALKSQLDTFYMWQQEVLKTHETHKQKFLETKDLILKLRAENAHLKKQVEEGSSIVNGDIQENVKNFEVINVSDGKEADLAYKLLVEENEKLKMENQRLSEELKSTKSELGKVSNELEDVQRENSYLKQRNEEGKENITGNFSCVSLPNSEARAQISNLFKQLEEEREKVSKLKQQLVEGSKKNGDEAESKMCTTEVLSQYLNKLEDMNLSLDRQNQRFNSLQSWVSLAEENINSEKKVDKAVDCLLLSEIKQLKSHLNQEENTVKEKQESLLELRGQFQNLLDDYKNLQQNLNSLESNQSNIQGYKDKIENLTQLLTAKDTDLISKEKECEALKEEIRKLNLECEEVAILKIQAQLYQTDFKDERAARERLAEEKEKMAEEVRLLQRKVEELQTKGSEENQRTSPLRSEIKSHYLCPKCSFAFSDLKRCEEHIDECLNIHFYP